jgi:MFS family permease
MCGFAPVPSATAYGLLSGVNMVGMIAAGWFSDRAHRPSLLAFIYLVRAGAFVLLMNVGTSYPLLLGFSIVFGLFDYSTVPVTASYIAARLGVRNLGLAMGILSAGHAVGGALGAWSGGLLFDMSGGYMALWRLSIGLALAAVILVVLLSDEGRRRFTGRHFNELAWPDPSPIDTQCSRRTSWRSALGGHQAERMLTQRSRANCHVPRFPAGTPSAIPGTTSRSVEMDQSQPRSPDPPAAGA